MKLRFAKTSISNGAWNSKKKMRHTDFPEYHDCSAVTLRGNCFFCVLGVHYARETFVVLFCCLLLPAGVHFLHLQPCESKQQKWMLCLGICLCFVWRNSWCRWKGWQHVRSLAWFMQEIPKCIPAMNALCISCADFESAHVHQSIASSFAKCMTMI